MADPIKERLEQRERQHDLIREQVEIEALRDGSQQAATGRNRDVARSHDAAKTRGDLTRVAGSTRFDAPKTDKAAKPEKPADKQAEFKIADGRDLKDLITGRPQPKAPPPEARIRQAEARPEARQPRPAAENARPHDATGIAQDRAVQGRREAAIAERPRNDQLPREQAHLRFNNQKPLTTTQRQNLAARIRAYVANLFKPKGPSTAGRSQARQLQTSQRNTTGLPPSKTGSLPKGTGSTTAASTTAGPKAATPDAKEKGPVFESGRLLAYDGPSGDAEAIARRANMQDAFCRLGAGESPLVFDTKAWQEVQRERNQPVHVRHANNGGADHRRVEALRGRQKNA